MLDLIFKEMSALFKSLFSHAGVEAGCFRHRYTDFGHTNLGLPKLILKECSDETLSIFWKNAYMKN